MNPRFIRTAALFGENAIEKLKNCRVAVFGIGGVGSYVLEGLVRSGIGNIDIFDNDTVKESNINRQIIATEKTLNRKKVEVAKERAIGINPNINIGAYDIFYMPDTKLDFSKYDYVIDAIDTVTAKIDLIIKCQEVGVPIISIMGTGNKCDPTRLKLGDIYKTSVCPLARVMRTELKKRGVKSLTVVWSDEPPIVPNHLAEINQNGRLSPGSTAFVPATAGLIAASAVINDLRIK